MPRSSRPGSSGAPHAPGVPDHIRRFLDDDRSDRFESGLTPSSGPTARELTDAILADPESVARLVDAVGDAVERKIVRDLVRQGRAPYPGLV